MNRLIRFSIVCGVLVLLLSPAMIAAKQVRLDVSMSNPTMLAGKKQSTHLKVGLTGFKLQSEERTPVNVVLVLDKSGSMSGEKIAKAKAAAISAISRLSENDIVSVVTYDSTVNVLVPATKLTDKEMVCSAINKIKAGGSTALFAGVSKGAGELRKFLNKNRVNRVILLSDGLANVGPKSPSELGDLGASLLKEGISVSTMGLGLDYNEDLMTKLASKSGGNHIFIEQASDLVKIFNYEFNDVLSVVAQEVVIKIKVGDGLRPIKVLGIDAEINGNEVIVQLNQLYSEQEKYVLLEVEVPATKAAQNRRVADVEVTYANMQTKTTDRLASSVSVNFSESNAKVEESINRDVMIATVLQIANEQNMIATALRDKGEIAAARACLLKNADFLGENAEVFLCPSLSARCEDNKYQAQNLDDAGWKSVRKQMRRYQHADGNQQSY